LIDAYSPRQFEKIENKRIILPPLNFSELDPKSSVILKTKEIELSKEQDESNILKFFNIKDQHKYTKDLQISKTINRLNHPKVDSVPKDLLQSK